MEVYPWIKISFSESTMVSSITVTKMGTSLKGESVYDNVMIYILIVRGFLFDFVKTLIMTLTATLNKFCCWEVRQMTVITKNVESSALCKSRSLKLINLSNIYYLAIFSGWSRDWGKLWKLYCHSFKSDDPFWGIHMCTEG